MEENLALEAYNNIRQHYNEDLDLYDENSQREFWDKVIDNTTNIPGVLREDDGPSTSRGVVAVTAPSFLDEIIYRDLDDNGLNHYEAPSSLNTGDHDTLRPIPEENVCDKIFENLEQDDQTTEAEPSVAIATKLYSHQKQALNWMIEKENKNALPPFWEQHSKYCINTITKEMRRNVDSIYGGILADDMGLGKTLVMISLIMTNFVDSKPLACLLPSCEKIPQEYTDKKKDKSKKVVQRSIKSYFSTSSEEAVMDVTSNKAASSDLKSQQVLTIIDNSKRVMKRMNIKEEKETAECMHSPEKYAKLSQHDHLGLSDAEQCHVQSESLEEISDPDNVAEQCHIQSESVEEISDPDSVIYVPDSSEEESSTTASSNNRRDKAGEGESSSTVSSYSSRDKAEVEESSSTASSYNSRDKAGEEESSSTVSSSSSRDKEDAVLFETITPSWQNSNAGVEESSSTASSCNSRNKVCDDNDFLNYDPVTGRCRTSGPRGTLIICPTSVLSNWKSQFEQHVDKRVHINLYVHYGKSRNTDVQYIKMQDVVITTYHTVIADNKKNDKGPLYNTEWLRIVLDEGHTIRNPKTCTAKVIFELKAQRRWVLTGTPIQNSLEDLWSIINFLRVEPLTDKKTWNSTIAYPMANKNESTMQRIFHLMRNLSLRRTKTQKVNGKPVLDLPARNVVLKKLTLSQEQRQTYDLMENDGKIKISRYIRNNTIKNHLYEIFVLQLRLRQFCCHPKLVYKAVVDRQSQNNSDSSPGNSINTKSGVEESSALTEHVVLCQICFSSPKNAIISSHGWAYCWNCLQQNPAHGNNQANASSHEDMNGAEMKLLIDQLNSEIKAEEECIICTNSLNDGVITSKGHVYCRVCFENNPDITHAYETITSTKRKYLIGELLIWLDMDEEYKECPICYTKSIEIGHKMAVITFCGHQFCSHCIEKLFRTQPQPTCPICRHPLDRSQLIKVPRLLTEGSDNIDGWKSSAKFDALMTALSEQRQSDPSIKSIVVSQFTSLLDLVEKALRARNFVFTRLDGRMSQKKRNQAMENFSDTSVGSPTVFLLSLKAGGVGINLTAASKVFLMDPAWNPAAEEQCFDRCHRLGQTRDVEITKFIIENSVEENLLKLQEKKRRLMTGAFLKKLSQEERRRKYINDLLDFFPDLRSMCKR